MDMLLLKFTISPPSLRLHHPCNTNIRKPATYALLVDRELADNHPMIDLSRITSVPPNDLTSNTKTLFEVHKAFTSPTLSYCNIPSLCLLRMKVRHFLFGRNLPLRSEDGRLKLSVMDWHI